MLTRNDHRNFHKGLSALLLCLAAIASPFALATEAEGTPPREQVRADGERHDGNLRAAAITSERGAMYMSVDYFRTHPGDNPTVESGRLTFLYWEDGSVKTKVLDCVNNADLLTTYQASSYGKSTIGNAIGMNCGKNPRGEDLPFVFVFVLTNERPGHSVRKIPNAVLGSEVATWGCKPEPRKIPSSQFQSCHERIQVDHLSVAPEGVMPV
jgi:hypothetical protein